MTTVNATAPVIKEPRIHITSRGRLGWAVVPHIGKRALRVFESRKEAINFARALANIQNVDLIVHGRDGTVDQWIKAKKA